MVSPTFLGVLSGTLMTCQPAPIWGIILNGINQMFNGRKSPGAISHPSPRLSNRWKRLNVFLRLDLREMMQVLLFRSVNVLSVPV